MRILKIVIYAAVLLVKTPGLLLSFVNGRRRGTRIFHRELLKAGMAPDQAEELTRIYKDILWPKWKEFISF